MVIPESYSSLILKFLKVCDQRVPPDFVVTAVAAKDSAFIDRRLLL